METPPQRVARLVTALEELVAEETTTLRHGDFAAAAIIAERAEPVVDWIVNHVSLLTPELRERLAGVRSRRAANETLLAREIECAGTELRQVAASRRRVAQIAPVYGHAPARRPLRLSAVG
jgi:hypothetical protein